MEEKKIRKGRKNVIGKKNFKKLFQRIFPITFSELNMEELLEEDGWDVGKQQQPQPYQQQQQQKESSSPPPPPRLKQCEKIFAFPNNDAIFSPQSNPAPSPPQPHNDQQHQRRPWPRPPPICSVFSAFLIGLALGLLLVPFLNSIIAMSH